MEVTIGVRPLRAAARVGGGGGGGAGASDAGSASPLIYLKGIREVTYGVALVALQYLGQEQAVTVMAGVMSLAGLGDGVIVRLCGGPEFRGMAFGHWGAGIGLVAWAWCRASS
ncbi:hypothetical protein GGR52DRAFT_575744 [Hypoxylon sp. FL1284]|nr:hypothetical protein GGR52DRAFT_575744 [Hypoxylon sp. FL1284]